MGVVGHVLCAPQAAARAGIPAEAGVGQQRTPPTIYTRELRGQTVGIVGYGAIGREIARLNKALGLRVLATKRTENFIPQI